jgi:hypothetical protein
MTGRVSTAVDSLLLLLSIYLVSPFVGSLDQAFMISEMLEIFLVLPSFVYFVSAYLLSLIAGSFKYGSQKH